MIREIQQPQLEQNSRPHYLEAGTGPVPVIFLHGLFGRPADWWTIMEELSDHHRFIAPQLPIDYSATRRYRSFRSLGQLTDFVLRFMDDLGLDRAVLCGNSLGGQLALDCYLRQPERVDRLVLCGSAGLFERSLSGGPLKLSRDLVHQHACEIFHDPAIVTDQMVDEIYTMLCDRNYRRFLLRVAKATRDRYMLDELSAVQIPTMVIWGRNDSITPPFVAEQFRDGIQQSKLTFLDQCGHAPPIERPREFARELHAFLTSSTPDRGHAVRKPR